MKYPIIEKTTAAIIGIMSFALIFAYPVSAKNSKCITTINGQSYDISYFLKNNYQSATKEPLFHSCPIDAHSGFAAEFGENYIERLEHYKTSNNKTVTPDTVVPRLAITAPTEETRYDFTSETGEFYLVGAASDNMDSHPSITITYQGQEYTEFQKFIAPEGLSRLQVVAKDISGNFQKKKILINRTSQEDTQSPELFISYPSSNIAVVKSDVNSVEIIGSVHDNQDTNPQIESRYEKNNTTVLTQGFPTVELTKQITIVEITATDSSANSTTKTITIQRGINEESNSTDSDRDGLSDSVELSIGTDPYKADSDQDGYADKEEIMNFYNPQGTGALFSDVSSAKHKAAIVSLVQKGAIKVQNNSFNPQSEIKRVEALKILTETFPTTQEQASIKFHDVYTSHWFYNIIQRSVAQGVVNKNQENFFPAGSLKRAEALKMIFNSAQLPIPSHAPAVSNFSDVNTQDWFAPFTQIAAQNELLPSSWNHSFQAGKNITRAEFAQIAHATQKVLESENFVTYAEGLNFLATDEDSLQKARLNAKKEDQIRKENRNTLANTKQAEEENFILAAQNRARTLLGMPISLPTITTTNSGGSSGSSSSSSSSSSTTPETESDNTENQEVTTASTAEQEEAARIAAEQEAQRIAEEMARQASEEAARRAAEEAARIAQEEADMAAVDAARIAAAEEARRQAEEAARIAAEQEAARQAAEEAARRAAEEEAARLAAEEAARQQAEEAARQAAEEMARRAAEEMARRMAEEAANQSPVTDTMAS